MIACKVSAWSQLQRSLQEFGFSLCQSGPSAVQLTWLAFIRCGVKGNFFDLAVDDKGLVWIRQGQLVGSEFPAGIRVENPNNVQLALRHDWTRPVSIPAISNPTELQKKLYVLGFIPENYSFQPLSGYGSQTNFGWVVWDNDPDQPGRAWWLNHPGPNSRFPEGVEII